MSAAPNQLAFPITPEVWATHPDFHGMTLRDWFAGQAINVVAVWAMEFTKDASPAPMAATMAYEIADAMLNERAKGGVA